ncbi:probable glutamate receptor [Periplaneta americana]|uniref:probable glutamate receptor n=1 Tax=Periplaneta americana TaxID=6978 RepID=UPI0037E7AD66
MSSNRLQTVDFTVPLFSFNFQVFIRQPDVRMNWNHYLSPFSHRVWSSLVLLLLQITVVLTIMYRLARYYGYINIVHPNFVYDAFFYIFTLLFCQQGHVPPVKNGPIHLVFLVTTLTAMVILAAYSAALVSSLAIESTQLPFNSFEGLLADGSYKLGVVKHSAVLTLFKDAEEGLFKNLFEKMMDTDLNDFPANEWNGLSRICADKKFAFMAPREFVISTIQKMRCRIVGLPQAVIRVSMSIPVMRKSPYIGLLNHNLCRLRSSGLLQGLQMRILFPEQNEQTNPTVIVKLENVAILLLVLFVGVIISLMILVVERKRRS